MIKLVPVKEEDKSLFWNVNQKYLYEMTLYYNDPMDEQGNYHYGHFEEYFIDKNRKAFFIFNDKNLVGFAMINPYSILGHNPDYTMAEFTIFPSFRRNGYATKAVDLIFNTYKGKWEIKFNENNLVAKKFWAKMSAPFTPTVTHLNPNETVLEFSNL